jgi:hypothetical protein
MSYSTVTTFYGKCFRFRLQVFFGRDKFFVTLPMVGCKKTDVQLFYFIPQFQSRFCRAVSTDKREIPFSISIQFNHGYSFVPVRQFQMSFPLFYPLIDRSITYMQHPIALNPSPSKYNSKA